MEQNKIPSLNVINGKTSPYKSKVILRHYHYCSDPKLGPGPFAVRIFPCNCHSRTNILSLYWDSKIEEAFNQPRYGRICNFKTSQLFGCHNIWIIMNILDKAADE